MSVTDPYAEDTPTLLTRTLTHLVTARVVMPDGETITLDVEGGRLGWDETRSPRVEATLTCRVPTDAAQLARIDPRTGARLEVDLGYTRPGGVQDIHTVADLSLQARDVTRPDDLMTLTARSDEALVIDDAASASLTVNTATTTAGMAYLIGLCVPSPNITVTASTGPAINQSQRDGDKWDALADLADRIGARVYDDGLRTWWITPTPTLDTPALELAVGDGGTIDTSDSGLGREGWYNRVYLKHSWVDTSDVEHLVRSVRSITSGTYQAVVGNTRTLIEERNTPATQTQADAAATSLVARTVTRGRSFSLSAVSAYWLRPGHTVRVTLPTGDPEDHLVVSVEFDLRTGLMDVSTRLPDNTGTIGA